jgi:hypothetical protein
MNIKSMNIMAVNKNASNTKAISFTNCVDLRKLFRHHWHGSCAIKRLLERVCMYMRDQHPQRAHI